MMMVKYIRSIAVAAIVTLALVPTAAKCAQDVSTFAGSGALGTADGPVDRAQFIFPFGVAISKDGTVYVSDAVAQRIKAIKNGYVRTVAGSGPIVPPGLAVVGGYRDGPAAQALFDGPKGLAIGPDGALYIADSGNAAIRRLADGRVTTVLGKSGQNVAVDGDLASARLAMPVAIAFDSVGDMFIADDGGGLREWSKGALKTIHLKNWIDPKYLFGVTVYGDSDPVVVATSKDGAFAYHPASGTDEAFAARNPFQGSLPYGVPNQIVALDRRQFVYTDEIYSNLTYLRLPAPAFAGMVFAKGMAGGGLPSPADNAGDVNGSRASARFYAPMGLALMKGALLVADGGNRKIRRVALPKTRVSEAGFDASNTVDDQHYEVGFVGPSWAFYDTLGEDSICASIEMTLDRSGRFHKPVRCHTIEIDGGSSNAFEDYIKNVFTVERMDLVIMDASSWSYQTADTVLPGKLTWGAAFRAHMQDVLDVLRPLGTQLALVWVYPAHDISNAEYILDDPGRPRGMPSTYAATVAASMQTQLAGLPILQYDIFKDEVAYEASTGASQLYQGVDQHTSTLGNAFFGTHFAQGLLDAGLGRVKK